MVVRVMHKDNVKPVQLRTDERRIDRSQYAVTAVISLSAQLIRHGEPLAVPTHRVWIRHKQSAHLGGHDELGTWQALERLTEASFRQSQPIVRRSVEISNARLPSSFYCLLSILVRSLLVEVANHGGTEADFGEGHVGAVEDAGTHFGPSASGRNQRRGISSTLGPSIGPFNSARS